MCGRYTSTSSTRRYADAFDLPGSDDPRRYRGDTIPRYNIAPGMYSWCIQERLGKGSIGFESYQWGLVPGWVDNPKTAIKPINARSEAAVSRPYFRAAMKWRRCVVPADGYYEWTQVAGKKLPWFIRAAGGEPMAFAGLYEIWERADGSDRMITFAILTTDASEGIRHIHDRMPCLLRRRDITTWLDPELTDVEAVQPLLKRWDGPMESWRVSTKVNSGRNEGPELIDPIDIDSQAGT